MFGLCLRVKLSRRCFSSALKRDTAIPLEIEQLLSINKVSIKFSKDSATEWWNKLNNSIRDDTLPFYTRMPTFSYDKVNDKLEPSMKRCMEEFKLAISNDNLTIDIDKNLQVGADSDFTLFSTLLAHIPQYQDHSVCGIENQILHDESGAFLTYAHFIREAHPFVAASQLNYSFTMLDNSLAAFQLSRLLMDYEAEFGSEARQKSFELMKFAYEKSITSSRAHLALMLADGYGTEANEVEAYEMVKDGTDLYCQLVLANMLMKGNKAVKRNPSKATEIWSDLTSKTEEDKIIASKAGYNLGNSYFLGLHGGSSNYNFAHDFWKFALDNDPENGHPALHLGNLYFEGLGVVQDYEKALFYYEQALNSQIQQISQPLANICKEKLNLYDSSEFHSDERENDAFPIQKVWDSVVNEKKSFFIRLFSPRKKFDDTEYVGGMKRIDTLNKAKYDALSYRWRFIEHFQNVH